MAIKNGREGITGGYRFGVFVNVVLICALAVAVMVGLVAFVRSLSYRHDLRFDLTRDHRYEIAPLARSLLRQVETPLRVTLVTGFDANIRKRTRQPAGNQPRHELLRTYYAPLLGAVAEHVGRVAGEWFKLSPHVEVGIVASFSDPARAEELATALNSKVGEIINKVILTMGGRRREIPLDRLVTIEWGFFDPLRRRPDQPPYIKGPWRVQAEMTNALRALSAGESTVIGVPEAVNARYEPRSGDFRPLATLLTGQGYEIMPFRLRGRDSVPEGVDILLLPAVGVLMEKNALRAVSRFERAGGRLLVVVDPSLPETWDELLEPYGIKVLDLQVMDQENSLARLGRPEVLRSNAFCSPESVISGPIGRRLPIHLGSTRGLEMGPDREAGARVKRTLMASRDARGIPLQVTEGGRKVVRVPGREGPRPSVLLAVEGKRAIDTSGTEARVVVIGGGEFLHPLRVLDQELGNRDLLLNALAWLSDRPAAIAIPPTTEHRTRIEPVSKAFDPIFWFGVVILPGLALLAALSSWLLRRN